MQKMNPWMLSTIFLLGLMMGFGIGRFIPGMEIKSNVIAERSTPQTDETTRNNPGLNGETANRDPLEISEPQTLTDVPTNDYKNLKSALTKDTHWALGSPTAKVKIEEFSDFQCPFCQRFFNQSFGQLLKNYVESGKVYYVFYNYPLDIHPEAGKAAEAALCAGDQKKYWEMHDLLFLNQNFWSFQGNHLQTFELLAQNLNLNLDQYKKCLSSNKYAKLIEQDMKLGEKKGISGTPTLFINGNKIVGSQPYEIFAAAIEEALKK